MFTIRILCLLLFAGCTIEQHGRNCRYDYEPIDSGYLNDRKFYVFVCAKHYPYHYDTFYFKKIIEK